MRAASLYSCPRLFCKQILILMQLFKFSDEEWVSVRPAWCLFVGTVDVKKALVASIGLRYQGVMLPLVQCIIPGGKNSLLRKIYG